MTLCTYLHKLPDGRVFYVGVGDKSRPRHRSNRSDLWKATAAGGYSIEIAMEWGTTEDAAAHEKVLIDHYKALGHQLINKQRGGGSIGRKHTDDERQKMSVALTDHYKKPDALAAISGERNHQYGVPISPEARAKISAAQMGAKNHMYGKTIPAEVRAKMAAAQTGKKASAETRAKMSAAQFARQAKKKLEQQGEGA